jgi:hypothetical protein
VIVFREMLMEQRHKHTLTFMIVLFVILSLMYLSGHHKHHVNNNDEPWSSSVRYDIVMEDEQGNVLHNYGEADLGGID